MDIENQKSEDSQSRTGKSDIILLIALIAFIVFIAVAAFIIIVYTKGLWYPGGGGIQPFLNLVI